MQIHFATVDLELHSKFRPGGPETVFDADRRLARRTMVMPPLPEDRFLCGFSHIFAGGYSAGYYSYKVGDCDCPGFELFQCILCTVGCFVDVAA